MLVLDLLLPDSLLPRICIHHTFGDWISIDVSRVCRNLQYFLDFSRFILPHLVHGRSSGHFQMQQNDSSDKTERSRRCIWRHPLGIRLISSSWLMLLLCRHLLHDLGSSVFCQVSFPGVGMFLLPSWWNPFAGFLLSEINPCFEIFTAPSSLRSRTASDFTASAPKINYGNQLADGQYK